MRFKSKDMKKIMHVLQSANFSGAENVVCQIVKMFDDNPEYKMIYVSRGGNIESVLEQMGIPFYRLEKLNLKSIRKAINILEPDIIHAHDISASVLAGVASIGKKCKIISHVHVNNSNMSKINIKTICYIISTIRYKHVFWVSRSCFDKFIFKNIVRKKSTILYNVMDKKLILKKENMDHNVYSFDVAYVGRLTEQKDPLRLVKVLAKLITLKADSKIAIVGQGNLEKDVKRMVEQFNLENNIIFTGFMNNPLKLLADSKVMIMTSKYEGLPMTVLEAMALGVPLVSTPVDGLKDIIEQGVNGYLENDDDVLAKRLYDIISDSGLRNRMSLATQKQFDDINDLEKYKASLQASYEM